jgi:hypothetical protein
MTGRLNRDGPFETEREASVASLWAQQGRDAGMTVTAARDEGIRALATPPDSHCDCPAGQEHDADGH